MAINSRSKGKRGEKQAIKFLEAWTGHEFASTPASGGLRWGKSENIAGDIVCVSKNYLFPLGIEVKFNKDINFEHLLYHSSKLKKSRIQEFWEQASSDAERAEKIPMLMMRYNGMPANFFFIVIGKSLVKHLWFNAPNELRPNLEFSKGVVITTTLALSKIKWKHFEEATWNLQRERYGKVGN